MAALSIFSATFSATAAARSLAQLDADIDALYAYIDATATSSSAQFEHDGFGTAEQQLRQRLSAFAYQQSSPPLDSAADAVETTGLQIATYRLWMKAQVAWETLNNRCLYWASEAGDRSDGSVSVAEINRRVLALENGTRLPMPQEPSPGLVGIDAVDDLVEDAFVLQNSFAELLSVPPPPTESTAANDRAQLSSYLDDFHASLWQLCPEGVDADQANQGDSLQIGGDTGYSVDCTSGLCSYTLVPAR